MNLADQFLSLAGCNVRLNKKKRVISDEARAASIKSKKLAKWKRYEEVFGEPGTILDTTSFSRKSGVASANQVLRSLEQDGKVELVGKEDTPGGQERHLWRWVNK